MTHDQEKAQRQVKCRHVAQLRQVFANGEYHWECSDCDTWLVPATKLAQAQEKLQELQRRIDDARVALTLAPRPYVVSGRLASPVGGRAVTLGADWSHIPAEDADGLDASGTRPGVMEE